MVDLYVRMIILGLRPYSKVNASLKEAVKAELKAQGLDTDGKPLEAETATA